MIWDSNSCIATFETIHDMSHAYSYYSRQFLRKHWPISWLEYKTLRTTEKVCFVSQSSGPNALRDSSWQ